MLHINKNITHSTLYMLLKNVYDSTHKQILYYSIGVVTGYTCCLLEKGYKSCEIQRIFVLTEQLEKAKLKQLRIKEN
jgi:hypothetical protein